MNRLSSLSCLLALLAGTNVAFGQAVTFRGKVEDVPGTANQFFVGGTNTQLTSPTIGLNAFLGQQVLINGVWNASMTSPSVTVQSISIVPRTFEVGGNGSLGGQMSFAAFGNPGESALLAMALQPSFLPMAALGVVFLDPSTWIVVGTGAIGLDGDFEVALPIPNDPVFLGVNAFGQGAIFGPGIAALITNPDARKIQN
jgi:hypothetical protein